MLHHRGADGIITDEPYRKHGYFFRAANFTEQLQVEGVIIVAKVQHTGLLVVVTYPC